MENECGTAIVLDRSFVIPNSGSEKRVNVGVEERSELGHKRKKVQHFSAEGIDTHNPKSWKNKDTADHFECTEEQTSNVTKETVATNSNVDFVKSRDFVLDLNEEDVSSSINNDPFRPYKSTEHVKPRDSSECGSSIGPLEPKDPMRVWKEMKQNGFLSSSNGGIPVPKPRGRKSKNDGITKKIEIAKKEQVDRFAKIAAPSGLLNGLNPGIINHVRNSKQVHSIIEALVRSEKRENRQMRTKYGTKDCSENKDLETLHDVGINRIFLRRDDDDESSMVERRGFGKTNSLSDFNLEREDDKLVRKLSSSTNMASEITSSLSNEDSGNLTSEISLSVKAANVAFQWLELLHQDIKGRLAALWRSKKRVRAVIQTELPFLMSREFPYNQENGPYYVTKTCDSDNASAEVHRARWSSLFDQMEKALCEEEKQLESWLNQVKEMQLHCESGLIQYNGTHSLQQLSTLGNDYRLEKSDNLERELAIHAAAASIYSTCNFQQSRENIPCL